MLVVVHVDDVFSIATKERSVKFGADLNRYVPPPILASSDGMLVCVSRVKGLMG